jgi:hypothetical protein
MTRLYVLTPQLLKITADHVIMRRLRLQQGESLMVAEVKQSTFRAHHLAHPPASLRYLQGSSRHSVQLGVEGLSLPTVSDLTIGPTKQPLQPVLIQPVDNGLAEERLM